MDPCGGHEIQASCRRGKRKNGAKQGKEMVVSADSPSVGAVVILDKDGGRIAGNYFEDQFRTFTQQQVRRCYAFCFAMLLRFRASRQPGV